MTDSPKPSAGTYEPVHTEEFVRASTPPEPPRQIGRYRVERLLGHGGFGLVYLAHDDMLQRRVAIKVPHLKLITRPEDAEAYLAEARTVAGLDHANIVPVFDVGCSDEFPCFVVSKYIEGSSLTKRIGAFPVTDAAELVATLAEALHYAHRQGLVHRDVKPGNILLDTAGKPFLADFGVALREENVGKGERFAGTPPYMSPEQARGEGHRVDGRSDIFSLGVVFYELLTGQRPFRGETRGDLLEQITSIDPRPPRQIDDSIPKELERICLRALSKRAAERYTTAKDFADDLRHFFELATEMHRPAPRPNPAAAGNVTAIPASTPMAGRMLTPASDQRPIKIVPKGLRSFDENDADFFLELLPGPRDRDGRPDSIRFWKTVIEADADKTFSVGLIYGPSGCGKSSLVKAGLLPILSKKITPIYIEATADETEARLLNGLRKHCPDLASHLSLKDSLAALRRGQGIPPDKKILIVLDQFEQWLHAKQEERNTELVQALRQCDGARLQCLVMVRDDFWLATTRFLGELEIDLLQGQNTAVVDLFDLDHAKKVLAALGRALGKLPDSPADTSKEQKEFLRQAVAGLAQDGKVICVRLALFAEMIKGKPWLPATLKAVGGMEGVGVNFLEDTFASPAANPKHRLHQKAARAVLTALLPETGTDIKGNMRSQQELVAASGYAGRPKDFAEIIRILDRETRLVTPTDREGTEQVDVTPSDFQTGKRYYQLTHDYLVPALREWLTHKQKETRRGRAALQLEERASLWNGKPENRYLPSAGEWARIRLLTRCRDWTPQQHKVMRRADRYYVARILGLAGILIVIALSTWDYLGRRDAQALQKRLLTVAPTEIRKSLNEMGPLRRWLEPSLREAIAQANDGKEKLHLSLGLLRSAPDQVDYLYGRLFDVEPQVFVVVRGELAPYKAELTKRLWSELADQAAVPERRFRAACALAEYAPEDSRWADYATFVVSKLVDEDAIDLHDWKIALEPAGRQLLPALAAALLEPKWGDVQRRTIVQLYGGFSVSAQDPFAPLEEKLARLDRPGTSETDLAKGKANVAVALVALGKAEKVWPLLIHTPSPTLRSYLIERLGSSALDPRILKKRLNEENDTSARRALILALGRFAPEELPELPALLVGLYENDPDAGVHGAAGWVLRKWKQTEQLGHVDARLATGRAEGGRGWYIKKQGQTFSIIHGPQWLMAGAGKEEKTPTHSFAIAVTEVTVQQFRAFKKDHQIDENVTTTPNSPVNKVSWYDAAEYCNWLSKQDKISDDQLCYQRNKDGRLELVPDYQKRKGYRLPTEAEWEFACRAGAETSWSFGNVDEELIGKYAWWYANAHVNGVRQSFPVASLKPNDWGLFDMHGNLSEWCQESAKPQQGRFLNDIESGIRGGSYVSSYGDLACDYRSVLGRNTFLKGVTFRPVKSCHLPTR